MHSGHPANVQEMVEQCYFLAKSSSKRLLWLKLHLPEYLEERTPMLVIVTQVNSSESAVKAN